MSHFKLINWLIRQVREEKKKKKAEEQAQKKQQLEEKRAEKEGTIIIIFKRYNILINSFDNSKESASTSA